MKKQLLVSFVLLTSTFNGFAMFGMPEETIEPVDLSEPVEFFGPVPNAVQDIFDFAQDQQYYEQAGINPNSSILLEGPPGTGKSHLVHYIAQKLGVSLYEENGGSFHNKFIGVGPEKVRTLFKTARETKNLNNGAPFDAVLFIDEIEGIGADRSQGGYAGDENTRLMNALLAELTNKENKRVLVICATNLADALDAALIRTGRFGLHIRMDAPNEEERKAFFEAFLKSPFTKGYKYRSPGASDGTIEKEFKKSYDNDRVQQECNGSSLFAKLASMTQGFVVSDIKEAIMRALKKAVKRRSYFCSVQEILTAVKEVQKQKKHIETMKDVGNDNDAIYIEPADKEPVQWFGPLPAEANQILNFARNQDLFRQAGLDKTANVLLKGVPGTGKSHLARYVAQELDVPFIEENGGSFHNKWIGSGPAKLRKIFAKARNAAAQHEGKGVRAVLFIDEIEGIAASREGGGSSEETRLLNSLLAEMTNPENKNILVVCATNCPDILDSAVTRPGRFGLHVTMGAPEFENRKALFKAFLEKAYKKGHTSGKAPYSDALYQKAAQASDKFVAADIQEAVLRALTQAVEKRKASTITEDELMQAITTLKLQKNAVIGGLAKKYGTKNQD